jgi:putative nucleotidyltransferase with HDIG domain
MAAETQPAGIDADVRPARVSREPGRPKGHGRRLTEAFDALERFPVLAESRDRVLAVVSNATPSVSEMVSAVESDVGLLIASLRIANRRAGGRVATARDAVEVLSPAGVEVLAGAVGTFDFFESSADWAGQPERFRLHAVTVQRIADRIAVELGHPARDELAAAALLHDVGKLVLARAYKGYPDEVHAPGQTPEQRLFAERRELGVDHAMVGGVLARRWGLPGRMAATLERHHREEATGEAAVIRLADMLAHYSQDRPVSQRALREASTAASLDGEALRRVLFELPFPNPGSRRAADPCPLSKRELQVLRSLAQGRVYKQIASEVGLSVSTIRTHLHNIYGKLGAVDRAQAVLIATERGWL